MISRILSVSRVSPIEPYAKQSGNFDENSRKKHSLDFADILADKMRIKKEMNSDAYKLDMSSLSRLNSLSSLR